MKRKISFLLALTFMLSLFCASAAMAAPWETADKATAALIIEKAKAGDKEAIEKIKGLDMFDKDKVKKEMASIRLTKQNPKATIAFADGSSIEISTGEISGVGILSGQHYYSKYYKYLGVVFGQMTLNWQHTTSGNIMNVYNCYVSGWCEGSIYDKEARCTINNDNPVTIWGQATFSPFNLPSDTMEFQVNHYLNGDTYERF